MADKGETDAVHVALRAFEISADRWLDVADFKVIPDALKDDYRRWAGEIREHVRMAREALSRPAPLPEGEAEEAIAKLEEEIELVKGLHVYVELTEDEARTILAALRSRLRAPEPGWQPIETAPWDGPPVLLWRESSKEIYVAARIRGANGPGWCTPDGYEIFKATHWMPLPAAPTGHTGEGG